MCPSPLRQADLPRERGDLSPSNIALLTGNFGANIGVDLLGFDTLGLEANEAGEKLLVRERRGGVVLGVAF